MSDNTTLPSVSTPGDVIRSDDVGGGVKIPVAKLAVGDDGVEKGLVSRAFPLPVEDWKLRRIVEELLAEKKKTNELLTELLNRIGT